MRDMVMICLKVKVKCITVLFPLPAAWEEIYDPGERTPYPRYMRYSGTKNKPANSA